MTTRDAQLAALLRRTQWMLDDAAFDLPAGRVDAAARHELAGALDELARALRTSATSFPGHLPQTRPATTPRGRS